MARFVIFALLWMYGSFGLLWWVQVSIDHFHIDAAETLGEIIAQESIPNLSKQEDGPMAVDGPMRQIHVTADDFERIKADRTELLRRLRVMWITLTLCPMLIAAFYFARRGTQEVDPSSE